MQETIRWRDIFPSLVEPPKPGSVAVPGVGQVGVTEQDIQAAEKCGGDPEFELIDCTAATERVKCYRLGAICG